MGSESGSWLFFRSDCSGFRFLSTHFFVGFLACALAAAVVEYRRLPFRARGARFVSDAQSQRRFQPVFSERVGFGRVSDDSLATCGPPSATVETGRDSCVTGRNLMSQCHLRI